MSWIKTIAYEESSGSLKTLYDRIKGPQNYIDNILLVHSLRPHTLEGHMSLYKNTLHHSHNELPKWLLECIGIYVSLLNSCNYCVQHHFAGLKRLLQDDDKAHSLLAALKNDPFEPTFNKQQIAILAYVKTLTKTPNSVESQQLEAMRSNGLNDGEILEVNQVASYFAYANRTVLGLGCSTQGDVLGLSPSNSDDPKNWGHQ